MRKTTSVNLTTTDQPYIDPEHASHSELGQAIDYLNNQIRKIESACGPSRRTQFLREEVLRLETQVALA